MIGYLKKRLSAKMLVVLVVILAISFAGLGLSVIRKQGDLLTEMRESVYAKLKQTGDEARTQFDSLEKSVGSQLTAMGKETALNLSEVTTEALSTEEANIGKGMEKLLVSNAEAVAAVLAKVGESRILEENYSQLVDFTRAVAQTEEIVFAFYLDKDDAFLPSYINIVDDLVISYLRKGDGEDEDDLQIRAGILLNAARNDPSVMLHELVIEYFGLPLGKVIVCVNRIAVTREVEALAARFEALKNANEESIKTIIEQESQKVIGSMKNDLERVAVQNNAAIDETGRILETSALDVKSGTTLAVLVIGAICCLGVIVAVGMMLRFMVVKPIHEITEGLRDAAEGDGDLTKRLSISRPDEIGMLAKWFDTFVAKLNTIIVDIGANSETVTSSAFEVLSASDQMLQESDGLKKKASSVAASSEEMDVSMTSVAAASEEASTNIGFVAEAASEMREALDGVVLECDRAQGVSQTASTQVKSATDKVAQLGEAARDISKVSEVITEIADQTNLLALNATIEAARAGDAGKGFAVVAGEIKELANQTQQATQQIKGRIEDIQASTNDTVQEVGLIADVIRDVDAIISSIAISMAEQSARAAEVAQNIEQASQGIAEVNQNVAQSSHVSTLIAENIAEVNEVAADMSSHSADMRASAEGLSELATQLRQMISIFKVSVEEADKSGDRIVVEQKHIDVKDLFVWSKQLETGFESVDTQHKRLVKLVNELHRAMKNRAGAKEAGRILNELATYTKTHFAFEEEFFEKYKYPAIEQHKKAHKDLVDKVTSFSNDFNQGKAGLSMDLMNFLSSWLRDHIMKTDMAYVKFFEGKDI